MAELTSGFNTRKESIVINNLVPRVCLFAGYVVAWLWGNRIEIVIWLAAGIINVADTLMRVFCENCAWTYVKRELSMFIRFGIRKIQQYKSKDIILIVWKNNWDVGYILTKWHGIYEWLFIDLWVYCMWKRRRTSFVFIPW
jgi:hypothetical protein